MKAKLQALWTGFLNQLKDIWNRSKMFIIGGLVLAGYLSWRQIKEWFLAYFSKKEIQSDNKKDVKLDSQEKTENQDADALVIKAQNEPNPGDDWNTK
jgi:hypothetical protein